MRARPGRGEAGRARAAAGRALAAAVGGQGCVRAGGLTRGIYLVQPRQGSGCGTAAPRSVARQDPPRHRSPSPALATSALCRATMHDTAQAFGRAYCVSFKKKSASIRFKITLKKG